MEAAFRCARDWAQGQCERSTGAVQSHRFGPLNKKRAKGRTSLQHHFPLPESQISNAPPEGSGRCQGIAEPLPQRIKSAERGQAGAIPASVPRGFRARALPRVIARSSSRLARGAELADSARPSSSKPGTSMGDDLVPLRGGMFAGPGSSDGSRNVIRFL